MSTVVLSRVGKSPNGGIAVYATQDIEAGTIINEEQPIIECQAFAWAEWGRQCGPAVDRLIEGSGRQLCMREKYIKLFSIMLNHARLGINSNMVFLFLAGSQLNHSCAPNALTNMNHVTGSEVIRARRRVRKGEEITASFIKVWAEDHKSVLHNLYGFECQCPLCNTNDMTMNQTLRARYEEAFRELQAKEGNAPGISSREEKLEYHTAKLEAHRLLGPSWELLREATMVVLICKDLGYKTRCVEALAITAANASMVLGAGHVITKRVFLDYSRAFYRLSKAAPIYVASQVLAILP
ncbi:hypothetical protein TruAng_002233 [Truncatella angustata]|nr:hypothetical protein TruAng_002233 [Truncatella angustata]